MTDKGETTIGDLGPGTPNIQKILFAEAPGVGAGDYTELGGGHRGEELFNILKSRHGRERISAAKGLKTRIGKLFYGNPPTGETKYGEGTVLRRIKGYVCPNCGKKKIYSIELGSGNLDGTTGTRILYKCAACGFNGHLALFEKDAIKKKNKLPGVPRQQSIFQNLLRFAIELLGIGILVFATGAAPLFSGNAKYIFYIFAVILFLVEAIHTFSPAFFMRKGGKAAAGIEESFGGAQSDPQKGKAVPEIKQSSEEKKEDAHHSHFSRFSPELHADLARREEEGE